MAQIKTPKAQEFDVLIIGGGLAGLLAANALEHAGRSAVIVEAHDVLGGASRAGQTFAGAVEHGLKVIPASEAATDALDWLETVLDQKIERTLIEAAPITYDEGKFKPYVGFGDRAVLTSTEIEAYALHQRFSLSTGPKEWVARLGEQFTGPVFKQSQVTKMSVDDGFVIEVLVNGAKRITARDVVFTAAPQILPALLGDALAPRVRQKLTKGEFWTGVNLDLVHREAVTDSAAVHVLKGANEEPCVGIFQTPVAGPDGTKMQVSQWLTLIPRDQTEEEELIGSALKQIKRQIKRAYESASEGLVQERILVVPASHGQLADAFESAQQLPKIENLWLTSAQLSNERNTLGTLVQTRAVISSLLDRRPSADANDNKATLSADA